MIRRRRPHPDQRIGQRLAFLGGARILAEAERAPSPRERIRRWQFAYARLPFTRKQRALQQ